MKKTIFAFLALLATTALSFGQITNTLGAVSQTYPAGMPTNSTSPIWVSTTTDTFSWRGLGGTNWHTSSHLGNSIFCAPDAASVWALLGGAPGTNGGTIGVNTTNYVVTTVTNYAVSLPVTNWIYSTTVTAGGSGGNSTTNWGHYGDSITFGVGASIGYVQRLATLMGLNSTNFGVSGYTAADIAHLIWNNHTNVATQAFPNGAGGGIQGHTVMIGANDQHFSNSIPITVQCITAELGELSLPDSYRVFARAANTNYLSVTGSWYPSKNSATSVNWAQGVYGTNGAGTLTFTNIGSSILLVTMTGSVFDLWLDGSFYGSINTITSGTLGATNYYHAYYAPDGLQNGIPQGFLLSGLPATVHTLMISNPQPAFIEWAAGLNYIPDALPVIVGEVTPQKIGYAAGGSDTNRTALNAAIGNMIQRFASAGLTVLPAKTGGLSPFGTLSDDIHLNDTGAAQVAAAFAAPMQPWTIKDRTLYQYATQIITNTVVVAPPAVPILAVYPNALAFGSFITGTVQTASIGITNIGTGTLSGTASGLSSPFSVSSGTPYSLAAGVGTNITIQFSAATANTYNGTLALTGGGGTNIAVTGTAINGVAAPAIYVTPSAIVLNSILTNTTTTATFTVQNSGGGTLAGTASVASPFTIASGSYSLTAGQTFPVVVSYSSATAQTNTATVTFTGGAGATASITGGATNYPAPPIISVIPSSFVFTPIMTNTTATTTFVVQNSGGSNLSGTVSGVSTPFSVTSGGTYSVAAGGSANVVVQYSPSNTNAFTNTLAFTGGGGTTATVSGWATNMPPMSLATGIIHAWSLDEATGTPKADSVGGSTLYDYTLNSVATNGVIGGATHFSASSVCLLSNTMASPFANSYTISAWAKFNVTNRAQTIVAKAGFGYAAGSEFSLYYSGGSIMFVNVQGTIGQAITSNPTLVPILPNTWYFVTVVQDTVANTVVLGVNGVFTAPITRTKIPVAGSIPFTVGGFSDRNSNMYDVGDVDSITIWSRTLTTNELNTVQGQTTFPPN